jgi:hypothetical protein
MKSDEVGIWKEAVMGILKGLADTIHPETYNMAGSIAGNIVRNVVGNGNRCLQRTNVERDRYVDTQT